VVYQVNGSRVEWNPAAARLRELTEEIPNASVTEFGNVNVEAGVDSRSTRSTYLVDDSTNCRGQTINRAEYERVAALQDTHIAGSHMVVTIPVSSAIVPGIVEGGIEWAEDPDFGYEVASAVPGVDDIEILQPRRLYRRQGRTDEYDAMVARLKQERKEFLASFPGLDESGVKSLG
jgi:ATP-dependent phosphoenolpyruvate carboxykinase